MQLVVEAAYHANIIAYTAARFDQTAKEDDTLGHGCFTCAVVEAFEGKGGIAPRRQVSTKELADYVKERVGQLAKVWNATQRTTFWRAGDRGQTPRSHRSERGRTDDDQIAV